MNMDKIKAGENPPFDINVIIEVPVGGDPIKYEMDKESGAIVVDRFLHTPMRYPCNYGFIPHTLSDDGDPTDVLVVGQMPLLPGSVVRCRPVGVLLMEDEAGFDEKIVAVPHAKLTPYFDGVNNQKLDLSCLFSDASKVSVVNYTTKLFQPSSASPQQWPWRDLTLSDRHWRSS